MSDTLLAPSKYTRLTSLKRGIKNGKVDREKRAIYGLSLISRGEALGKEGWVDEQFVKDLTRLCNERDAEGSGLARIKSRLAHPGLSGDGITQKLGHVHNVRKKGNQTTGDLFFLKAASKAPGGDLADYVMTLAEETPDTFGGSIVFEHDLGAEDEFMEMHMSEGGVFKSPDKLNKKNLPHLRIQSIKALDIVDDPAANPDGLFSEGNEIPAAAEGLLAYLFDLRKDEPPAAFGFHPSRIKNFFNGFLARHGLMHFKAAGYTYSGVSTTEPVDITTTTDGTGTLTIQDLGLDEDTEQPTPGADSGTETPKQEELMADEKTPQNKQPEAPKPASVEELRAKYPEHPDFVLDQLGKGATIEQAAVAFKDVQLAEEKAKVESLKDELKKKPEAPKADAGSEPVPYGGEGGEQKTGFLALAEAYAVEHKCSKREALSAVASADPEAFAEYKAAIPPQKMRQIKTH